MIETEKVDWVYSRLEDDESKYIFERRKLYNETRDYKYIAEIIDKYIPELTNFKLQVGAEKEWIRTIREKEKKVIIFGAGTYGRKVLRLCGWGGYR